MMTKKTPSANDKKKDWLVKSSTKILGPFLFQEIVDLLKTRSMTILDEVRRTDERWISVRDHKLFTAIVHSLRFDIEVSEHTVTVATTSSPGAKTVTQTVTSLDSDEYTQTPFVSTLSHIQIPDQNSGKIRDIQTIKEVNTNTSSKTAHLTGRAFGVQNDLKLQKELEQKSSHLRIFLIAGILLLVFGFFGLQFYQTQRKSSDFERKIRAAIRYKSLQMYEPALREYKKAVALKEPDLQTQAQMAPLLIAWDGDTVASRRILEKFSLTPGLMKNQLFETYSGIGLAYLSESNFAEADRAFLSALSYNKDHLPSLLNMAWIKYWQKLPNEAFQILDQYQGNSNSWISLAQGLSLVELSKKEIDSDKIEKTIQKIQQSIQQSEQLNSELLFLAAILANLKGGHEASLGFLKKYIDTAHFQNLTFVSDPLVTKKWLDPQVWMPLCGFLSAKNFHSSVVRTAEAVCLLNINQEAQAQKIIEDLIKQNPKDPIPMLAQLHFFAQTHRDQEALISTKTPELQNYHSPLLIQGFVCLSSQDLGCAENSFKSVLERRPSEIYARAGLAQVFILRKQKTEALSAIRGGLSDEPQFLPFIEMRELLENQ